MTLTELMIHLGTPNFEYGTIKNFIIANRDAVAAILAGGDFEPPAE